MDNGQDTNQQVDNPKVESEEKPKVAETAEEKPKAVSTADVKPKVTVAPKAPVATATKSPPSTAARAAVGTSVGAKTKTVSSEVPPDPVNTMRRRIVWTSLGAFLATCFIMFLRFFLPRSIFEPSTIFRIGYPSDFGFGVDTKFQQQYRIIGSFGASMKNIAESLDKMAAGMKPIIDTIVPIDQVDQALKRMESRQVFGKIIVTF